MSRINTASENVRCSRAPFVPGRLTSKRFFRLCVLMRIVSSAVARALWKLLTHDERTASAADRQTAVMASQSFGFCFGFVFFFARCISVFNRQKTKFCKVPSAIYRR